MPDDALQRLRRAQHPGDRRQAHPADPQRDEHRRGGRDLGPRDRPARPSLRHRPRPRASRAAQARGRRRARTAAVARPLEHLQRPRGDQDREVLRARLRRRRRHRRHRRRGDVPQRARHRGREVLPGRLRRDRRGRDLRGAPPRRSDGQPPRADARGAHAHLQPRLLHVGRAAGRLDRGLPGKARPAFWTSTQAKVALWDEAIDEFNARTGVLESL